MKSLKIHNYIHVTIENSKSEENEAYSKRVLIFDNNFTKLALNNTYLNFQLNDIESR